MGPTFRTFSSDIGRGGWWRDGLPGHGGLRHLTGGVLSLRERALTHAGARHRGPPRLRAGIRQGDVGGRDSRDVAQAEHVVQCATRPL